MKKYPFSKKALRAMLAASIAFTPVVATGVPGVGTATKVHAQQDELSQKISRLISIYNNLGANGVDAYNKAASAVNGLKDTDWQYIIGEKVIQTIDEKTNQTGKAVEIAKALASIAYSANGTTLENQIRAFRTNYSDEFDDVFGPSVTVDKLLTFFTEAEKAVWNHLDEAISVDPNQYKDFMRKIRDEVEKNNPSLSTLDADIKAGIGVGLDDLFDMKQRLNNKLDLEAKDKETLKTALIAAILRTGNPYTTPGGGVGGVGGGGGATPPVSTLPSETKAENGKVTVGQDVVKVEERTNEQGQKEKVVVIDATKIANIVNNVTAENKEIAVPIGQLVAGEVAKAEVPVKLFADAASKEATAVLTIQAEQAAYKLPVAEIQSKLQDLVKKLGVASADDIVISISMNPVDKQQVAGKYKWNVVSNVVEFHVVASANGKTEPITRFTQYVERELMSDQAFNANRSVAVRINDDGTFASVPTLFNEKTATVKSLTNSAYTVIENNKTFADVDNGKTWAEKYIETLASKYIIKGKTDSLYAPKEEMTRAQFAVLLVRALGLPGETYDGRFKDVKGNEWFNANGELMAAVKHGIVQGNSDGTFAPNAKITRAQAAVMIGRAMKLGFLNYDFTKLNTAKKVTDFKDAKDVRAWAKEGVEKVYQAGIFAGRGDGRFYPNSYMKRDEMAKALAEFLVSAKLMNPIE